MNGNFDPAEGGGEVLYLIHPFPDAPSFRSRQRRERDLVFIVFPIHHAPRLRGTLYLSKSVQSVCI